MNKPSSIHSNALTTFSNTDQKMMLRALQLAKKGCWTTAPNPNVGCVIAQGDCIVGEGFHYRAGEPHAEVFALREAGKDAEGATAYVTLEPCSHFGRTPPCAKGLIEAKVTRVVCAMVDPNPQVAGRGIALLREAGIEVLVGLCEQDARDLNKGFIKRMTLGLPFVQLKLASSLDGKTALSNGHSQWITGEEARSDVQVFRAQASVILSTSSTVLADDPALNVRWEQLPKSVQKQYPMEDVRQPIRVIIDSKNRVTDQCRCLMLPGETWLVRTKKTDTIQNEYVSELIVPTLSSGQIDLMALMTALAERQVNQVWVEAGAELAGGLLMTNLVDELILYQAPVLMGSHSRSLMTLPEWTHMAQTPRIQFTDVRMIGQDVRFRAQVLPISEKE